MIKAFALTAALIGGFFSSAFFPLHGPRGFAMSITLDLSPLELDALADFRRLYAEFQRTTSSTPSLELNKLYSALSISAQLLAEALDKAARAQGV